jgi:hypothetical protein
MARREYGRMMPLIVEIIISVCILIGLYCVVGRLMESPRVISYAEHLEEQFEKNLNLYEDNTN